jgi:hypothetical protein
MDHGQPVPSFDRPAEPGIAWGLGPRETDEAYQKHHALPAKQLQRKHKLVETGNGSKKTKRGTTKRDVPLLDEEVSCAGAAHERLIVIDKQCDPAGAMAKAALRSVCVLTYDSTHHTQSWVVDTVRYLRR